MRIVNLVLVLGLGATNCNGTRQVRCEGRENCTCSERGECNSDLQCINSTCVLVRENGQGVSTANEVAVPSVRSSKVASVAEPDVLARVVSEWNAAHNAKDTKHFAKLYAHSVLYYGRRQSSAACVASKSRFLAKNPEYTQTIVGDVHTRDDGVEGFATFLKRVTLSGKATDYPSYLGLAKTAAGWRIRVEGDEVTDSALQKTMGAQFRGAVKGDWDGDGQLDSVRLIPPMMRETDAAGDIGDCVVPCTCKLVFETLPPITIENCIGGVPVNEGDLNDDGADEIGILPDWWTSCWRGYRVYGLRHGQWVRLVVISTHCDQWAKGVDVIEKDETRPGRVIIRSTDISDFTLKSKSVQLGTQ